MTTKFLRWNGEAVEKAVVERMRGALSEFGLRAEGYAKHVLYKGHGVITGTLRRSIHTAGPDYAWRDDDVEPARSTPEMGNRKQEPGLTRRGLVLLLGSGLRYALPVHQGHHGFTGYHFLTIGVDKAKADLPKIIEKFRLKRKK